MKFLPETATAGASVTDCAALHVDLVACFLPLLEG